MAVFLIERNFAEKLSVTPDIASEINEVNAEEGVQWLLSFLSPDKKKTYCLYEASSEEAILAAAKKAGIPADVIVPVSEIQPSGITGEVKVGRFR